MKKITCLLSIIFVAIIMVVPAKVFASDCSSIKNETACANAKDSDGNKCFWDPNHSRCDRASTCKDITNETACANAKDTTGRQCYWDTTGGCKASYNTNGGSSDDDDVPDFLEKQETVTCGNIKDIPEYIPFITSLTVTILTIISMGMLVIMGTIDLFKGINSGSPDDMKKCQKAFYSRLGSALLLFFIVALTKVLVNLISNVNGGGGSSIINCISCFINNSCH